MKSANRILFACLGLAGSVLAADLAHAQVALNGTGSSAGRQYASLTPTSLSLCDAAPTPIYYRDTNNPPNKTEWQCNRGGVPTVYRYSATASADGYLKQPNGATATASYLLTTHASCPAPAAVVVGGRNVLQSICTAANPFQNLVVNFGASDVKAASFAITANGTTLVNPPAGHLTANPIVAVPFSIVLGGNVRAKGGAANITSLPLSVLRQILSGDVETFGGDWQTLGYDTTTANKVITVCQRTPGSGTLAALQQTVMQVPQFSGINPTASATNIFNASSSNVKTCVENNPNSIGYIDADTVPNLLNGAYQVGIGGLYPSNAAYGVGIAKTKDVRCGGYVYWADWNIVTRNGGVEVAPVSAVAGTNAAIAAFQAAAIANNPLPDYWAGANDTFVFKPEDKGPHSFLTSNGNGVNSQTVCQ
jgi:hypothetical protein